MDSSKMIMSIEEKPPNCYVHRFLQNWSSVLLYTNFLISMAASTYLSSNHPHEACKHLFILVGRRMTKFLCHFHFHLFAPSDVQWNNDDVNLPYLNKSSGLPNEISSSPSNLWLGPKVMIFNLNCPKWVKKKGSCCTHWKHLCNGSK